VADGLVPARRRGSGAVKYCYLPIPVPGEGDAETVNALWLAAVRQMARKRGIALADALDSRFSGQGRSGPSLPPGRRAGSPPFPEACQSEADLIACMRRLRVWAGNPSLRELESRAEAKGHWLPHSTLGRALAAHNARLPTLRVLTAFVYACGAEEHWRVWAMAWDRVLYFAPTEST
jgi:hypothetical protein